MSEISFYVTGGTLPPDSASYIERAADTELLEALQKGELCYVLNARQMGKSSLSVRTRQALEAAGTRTAFLDLQKFGSSASAEQWYRAILERIGNDLKLRPQFLAYWRDNAELPPLTRVFNALRDVALAQLPGKLVVFLDEIDVVRDLDFKTDEFFGAIRETHNARAEDPELKRLTFCILGTVAPTDLIRDIRLSPFNIGVRIKLADFTPNEAAPLAAPLPGTTKTLERVLWWTSGHPYLTQRLCAELTKTSSADVDSAVARLFFSKSDADVDENIKNVRNGVLRMGGEGAGFDRVDLLTRYGKLASGKRVPDDDTDGVCTALRLSGLVTSTDGVLRVRNRVYAKLFDAAWIRDNLPDAELRRQKAAVAKARWQIGSIAAAVLLAMGGLTTWALKNARRADANAMAESKAKTLADAEKTKAQESAQAEGRAKIEALNAQHKAQVALAGESKAKAEAQKKAQEALAALKREASAKTAAESALRGESAAKTTAQAQTLLAEANADMTNRVAYISSANQAQQAIENENYRVAQNHLDNMESLLKRSHHLTAGYEWTYLNELAHPEKFKLLHNGPVTYVKYFSDNQRVLTISNSFAQIWNSLTGKKICSFNFRNPYSNITLSRDETKILATNGFFSEVWDISKKRLILNATFQDHMDSQGCCFSPDGKRVLVQNLDGFMRVWDVTTSKEVIAFKAKDGFLNSACFSADGKRILTGGREGTVQLWDVRTGRPIHTHQERNLSVTSVAFSHDEKRFATGAFLGTARIWDISTGKELLTLKGHNGSVKSIEFSLDGKRIVTTGDDRKAILWDSISGKQLLTIKEHGGTWICASLSNDGKHIITGSTDFMARISDISTKENSFDVVKLSAGIIRTYLSADGKRITGGCWDNAVRVWDASTGGELLKLTGHRKSVNSVCFSPDGKRILTASDDSTARVWDASTGRELLTLRTQGTDGHMPIYSVAFSPDGKRILTGDWHGHVHVRNSFTGQEIFTIKENGSISSVCFSPDGRRILVGSIGEDVSVCDAMTGRELLKLKGHSDGIYTVSFSPDGKKILTGSEDTTARVWDTSTGQNLLTLRGHDGGVRAANFSPDGTRILTGSDDKTAHLWDASSGREILILKGHSESIYSAFFSPDGKRIYTTSADKTVRLWRRMTDAQVTEAARRQVEATRQQAKDERIRLLSTLALNKLPQEARAVFQLWPDRKKQIAAALNGAAWKVVDPTKPAPVPEVARQALEVAKLAVEYSDVRNGFILDTLAAAHFACGDLDAAVKTERKAVQLLPATASEATIADMTASLARYEKLWTERKK